MGQIAVTFGMWHQGHASPKGESTRSTQEEPTLDDLFWCLFFKPAKFGASSSFLHESFPEPSCIG